MRLQRNMPYGIALGATVGFALIGAVATAASLYRKKKQWNRFRGKTVLITGASRGLGLALAEEFGRKGARLILTARNVDDLKRAKELLLERQAVKTEEDIFIFPCDLRDADLTKGLIEEANRHFGRIDILVNNAGVITVGPLENQGVQDFHDVMDSNFFSTLHCTLAVMPQMLSRQEGTIVNITSIGGKVAVPHLLPYTASKFAAVGFSEGLHAEVRSKGIQVVTVCPGLMRTGSHLNALFTGNAEKEYRWFSLAAATPGLSASASRAAHKILRAILTDTKELIITPHASLAARIGNLFPELTMRSMQLINFFLPRPVQEPTSLHRGATVQNLEITRGTALASSAAKRYNQPFI